MNKKIPDDQIVVIKYLYGPEGGFKIRKIAEMYGISATQIHRILRGKRKIKEPAVVEPNAAHLTNLRIL